MMKINVRNFLGLSKRTNNTIEGQHTQVKKIHFQNLGDVKFVNSTVIANLINNVKGWMNKGFEVRFINVPDQIKRVIVKLGLDDIISTK